MRVLHGINDLVNDPGFLSITKTLELCSAKNIDCSFCQQDKAKKCQRYFDRSCTNWATRSKGQVKPEEASTQLKKLQEIGVSV